jgi:hypothetical protein
LQPGQGSNPLHLVSKYADEDDDDQAAVISEEQEQSRSLLGHDADPGDSKPKKFLKTDV